MIKQNCLGLLKDLITIEERIKEVEALLESQKISTENEELLLCLIEAKLIGLKN